MSEPRVPFRLTLAARHTLVPGLLLHSLALSALCSPRSVSVAVHYISFGGHGYDWATDPVSLSARNCSGLEMCLGGPLFPTEFLQCRQVICSVCQVTVQGGT